MTRTAHKTLPASWIADTSEVRPVFIVGMNGSGTTMLLDCLGRHSRLYGFPRETRLIPHLISLAPRYQPLHNDANFAALWRYAAGLAQFRLANGGTPKPLPAVWQRCSRDLAGLLNMLFLSYAWDDGCRERVDWCEKSPHNGQHMDRLAALYPGARFIHVIRDGRDSAYSFHRRWRRSPQLTMTRWKLLVRTARTQGRLLGSRYLEVHYENLTRSPEFWMERICEFLEVPFEQAVLESSGPYRQDQSGIGRLRENSGHWPSYFSPSIAAQLERIGGRALNEFGYSTACPAADHTPAGWRLKRWRAQDFAWQLSQEVYKRLRGRIERPWWTILIRPINAIRQARENRF